MTQLAAPIGWKSIARFWDESFDRLEEYLQTLQAKEKKRGRKID